MIEKTMKELLVLAEGKKLLEAAYDKLDGYDVGYYIGDNYKKIAKVDPSKEDSETGQLSKKAVKNIEAWLKKNAPDADNENVYMGIGEKLFDY